MLRSWAFWRKPAEHEFGTFLAWSSRDHHQLLRVHSWTQQAPVLGALNHVVKYFYSTQAVRYQAQHHQEKDTPLPGISGSTGWQCCIQRQNEGGGGTGAGGGWDWQSSAVSWNLYQAIRLDQNLSNQHQQIAGAHLRGPIGTKVTFPQETFSCPLDTVAALVMLL